MNHGQIVRPPGQIAYRSQTRPEIKTSSSNSSKSKDKPKASFRARSGSIVTTIRQTLALIREVILTAALVVTLAGILYLLKAGNIQQALAQLEALLGM